MTTVYGCAGEAAAGAAAAARVWAAAARAPDRAGLRLQHRAAAAVQRLAGAHCLQAPYMCDIFVVKTTGVHIWCYSS